MRESWRAAPVGAQKCAQVVTGHATSQLQTTSGGGLPIVDGPGSGSRRARGPVRASRRNEPCGGGGWVWHASCASAGGGTGWGRFHRQLRDSCFAWRSGDSKLGVDYIRRAGREDRPSPLIGLPAGVEPVRSPKKSSRTPTSCNHRTCSTGPKPPTIRSVRRWLQASVPSSPALNIGSDRWAPARRLHGCSSGLFDLPT